MSGNTLKMLAIVTCLFAGCSRHMISTVEDCKYDESKKQTDYFVLPFGSASIPGKWTKTRYNSVGHQQFFTNGDSVTIAIAFGRFDGYEFNPNGSRKGYDFIKAFYEWDSKYLADRPGMNRRIIEEDSIKNYILYQIYGSINGHKADTYFLIGEKNGNVSNLSITTKKWTKDAEIAFLKRLYFKK